MKTDYKVHFARSELDGPIKFATCHTCKETMIWLQEKRTLKMLPLDPKPTGGTELDPVYSRHVCATDEA